MDVYVWTARLASRASNGRADCADESSTDTSGERSRRDSSRSSTAGAAIREKRKSWSVPSGMLTQIGRSE
jgi:hypothetical protein